MKAPHKGQGQTRTTSVALVLVLFTAFSWSRALWLAAKNLQLARACQQGAGIKISNLPLPGCAFRSKILIFAC